MNHSLGQSVQQFAALSALPEIAHGFITRIEGVEVRAEKAEVLQRLDAAHQEIRSDLDLGAMPFATAQQVHGNLVHSIDVALRSNECYAGCDGLITNQPRMCLGIYVADCCAVFLVDPIRRAIGLVHSGKKGTEQNIVGVAIEQMQTRFGSSPVDLVVQLSPCIRPPHYEIDFASEIVRSCRALGVQQVHDCGICTACEPKRYYSYRLEKGKTGRMLALLAITR